jgi:hypothetical protein
MASIGSSITSPAKLAFAGYVILAYKEKICVSTCQFFIVAALFFIAQVLHDDFLRIWLNKKAELMADKSRRKEFPNEPSEKQTHRQHSP